MPAEQFHAPAPTTPKPELYADLASQLEGLMAGESDLIANTANMAAVIYHGLPDLNWAGFYLMKDGELVLGPFQGKPACIRIPVGKGVCGTAAETPRQSGGARRPCLPRTHRLRRRIPIRTGGAAAGGRPGDRRSGSRQPVPQPLRRPRPRGLRKAGQHPAPSHPGGLNRISARRGSVRGLLRRRSE